MWARILGSRGLMSATVIVVLVLAGVAVLKVTKSEPAMRSYCAEMPDSVGLYEGSAVTIMGVPVGRVSEIRPDGPTARVRFTVPEDRKLPPDVGAVTVSDTLIADRKLALVGPEPAGPGWDSGRCITRTLTPKSLTQTFTALAGLAYQLNGAGDPAQRTAVGSGLEALERATSGSGDQINAMVLQLSRALAAPDAAVGHIGQLIDALSELAHKARGSWSDVQESVSGLTQTFADINVMAIPQIVQIVGALAEVLPQLNDVITLIGTPTVRALNSIPDLPRLITAGVGSLSDVIEMAPAIANGFATAADPATGQPTIGYAPPKIALPQQDTTQICAAVQAITGQQCGRSENGAVTVPTVPLLLAAVSAR
ncbi:virulence factor Mce-like protein [Nocardia transvalensis]|uniref:Virulence factor Mce-like protein n=1 Tax=Nocardia transvalensis TaxID=37333 RepID=A0A7W9UM61_9NOCA|nr:MlaD family protein [Nocardia transvalensis]MBB5918258.1 virulence factor Mce-like protein [Nocardia transvalensis]